jgi:hypothetical protein
MTAYNMPKEWPNIVESRLIKSLTVRMFALVPNKKILNLGS